MLVSQFARGTWDKVSKMIGIPQKAPYMKRREMDIIEKILEKNEILNCLEWGSGYSTLYFPRFLSPEAHWTAIEHIKGWSDKIRPMNRSSKVEIIHVPVPNYQAGEEERYEDFKEYINRPAEKAPYDFILIDGRARLHCLEQAKSFLKEKGLILVHDINREEYQEALKKFPYHYILEDYRNTSGGLGFVSMDQEIKEYFDLDKHQKIWDIHSRNSSFFKFKWLKGK